MACSQEPTEVCGALYNKKIRLSLETSDPINH